MIRPKVDKPTEKEESLAYAIVTGRDSNRCQRCQRFCGPPSRDHRKGRGVGGLTTPANLQILGGDGTTGCHGWKTAHPALALAEGWTVPGWADPAEYPARRWLPTSRGTVRLSWVLYADDGTWREIDDAEAERRRT
jgi:hypothetical protein